MACGETVQVPWPSTKIKLFSDNVVKLIFAWIFDIRYFFSPLHTSRCCLTTPFTIRQRIDYCLLFSMAWTCDVIWTLAVSPYLYITDVLQSTLLDAIVRNKKMNIKPMPRKQPLARISLWALAYRKDINWCLQNGSAVAYHIKANVFRE